MSDGQGKIVNNEGDKMSDYTPTTESIKFAYVENAFAARSMSDDDTPAARAYEAELDARFGRWLAARDAEITATPPGVAAEMEDADLKEWAERIWGVVEYNPNNAVREMRAFIRALREHHG